MKLVPAKSYAQVMAWRRYNPAARAWWLEVRRAVYKRDKGVCGMCGRHVEWKDCNIHHQSYRHLFHEDRHLEDLMTTHEKCHAAHHRKAKVKGFTKRFKKW